MVTAPDFPLALRAITERLNFSCSGPRQVGRFQTYEVDLSDWSLSLTDANPCIWIKAADLKALSLPKLADNVRDVVRERGWQNSTILLFVDGRAEPLRTYLPPALPTFVLIGVEQQAQMWQDHVQAVVAGQPDPALTGVARAVQAGRLRRR